MAALMHLVATCIHQLNACLLPTHILESWLVADGRFSQRFPAESAFQSLLKLCRFFTVFTQVVRHHLATCTEIFRTFSASYSVFGHVFGRLSGDLLVIFIFSRVVDSIRNYLDDLTALWVAAHYYIFIRLDHHLHLQLLDFIVILLTEMFTYFSL